MSDLRFMATIYGRQGRVAELFKLWGDPPPPVQKIIAGAYRDYGLLMLEVAHRQSEWKLVEKICYWILEAMDPKPGDSEKYGETMLDICRTCWTVWKSLMEATTHLHPGAE